MKECSIMIHPRGGKPSTFLVTSTFCNAVSGVLYIYIYIHIYIYIISIFLVVILDLLFQIKLVLHNILIHLILDPCDIGGKNPCGDDGFCEVKANGADECIGIPVMNMFNFFTCHICIVLSAEYVIMPNMPKMFFQHIIIIKLLSFYRLYQC